MASNSIIWCPSIGYYGTIRRRNIDHGFQKLSYSTLNLSLTTTAAATAAHRHDAVVVDVVADAPRRSANYPPSLWSYEYLQSLTNNYVGQKYEATLQCLRETVRMMILKDTVIENPLSTLELVDDLQRLGISYHFKDEINNVLNMIYNCHYESHDKWKRLDLNLKALGFRILRQHGYQISQEIFKDIKDDIKASVCEDIVGMLNLYEASFFAVEDEYVLDEARDFTRKCLKQEQELENKSTVVDQSKYTSTLVSHALELPLLWRTQRFEAIWFIEAYKRRSGMKPLLLELAELDFNIVQGLYQEDLKHLSRWWNGLGWTKKLGFARDRLVESFMWAVGAVYEPPYGVLRRNITKLISLINVIDDVYDVYGTLDELEQFTDVVKRWDINAVEQLPDYMKICFFGFFNTINEMAYNTLTDKESLVISYVKKAWADYCDAALLEAQWFNSGYIPTLEEYLNNSCISISLPAILSNIYFFTSSDITGEALQNVVRCSSMILRLADDLGTSSAELKRGDVPKSIQCYMHESGACEETARAYIMKLIMETWKKLNKERMSISYSSSRIFIDCATNLGRMSQFTYQQNSDVFGSPNEFYKSFEISLLFNPKS